MTIKQDLQGFLNSDNHINGAPGRLLSLFTIWDPQHGRFGRSWHFVNTDKAVTYDGNPHIPHPIELSTLKNAPGASLRPTLRLSAVDTAATNTMLGSHNMRGATVTRTRTFGVYTDGGSYRIIRNAVFSTEVWRVEKLLRRDREEVTFQLASPLDFNNKKLPGRQVLRDLCVWTYRRWDPTANNNAGAWDLTDVTCPYRGPAIFDAKNAVVTNKALDVCNRRLSGCKKRYGTAPLPFGGFPAVGLIARS